jgi:hypothetical protein
MSDKKYCPIRHSYAGGTETCLEENCAWWDTRLEMCGILTIATDSAMKLIARDRE